MRIGEIKRRAKVLRNLARPSACLVALVYILIIAALNAIPAYRETLIQLGYAVRWTPLYGALTILLGVLTQMVAMGFNSFYALNLARRRPAGVGTMFGSFYDFGRFFTLSILIYFFVFLWTLLLVIPGIIAGYRYAMAPYILRDHPEISPMEAIRRSKEMMAGNKMRLFLLQLSFIGWMILSALTFGILSLWVTPHMAVSEAVFYETLCGRFPDASVADEDDGSYTMASFVEDENPEEYRELVDDDEEFRRYQDNQRK